MFGRNIPIKPVYEQRDYLDIIQLFKTIQGEGPLAGVPAIFIRLAGCNLKCFFCDTEFTQGAHQAPLDHIASEVDRLAAGVVKLVVLTGGEPLAQPIVPLIKTLVASDYQVQIETAGTVWQEGLEEIGEALTIVCSPKTASVHPLIEKHARHYKYIIRAGEIGMDGLPEFSTQEQGRKLRLYRPPYSGRTIWVQPCDENDESGLPNVRVNIDEAVKSAITFGHRLSFQIHKAVGVA